MKLNLGCGEDIREGFENIDLIKNKKIKKVNLEKYPLPWPDDSIDHIICNHLLEHLNDPLKFMLELHRICKNKAIIDISVPHFSLFAAYADLTHKKPGFSYFIFGTPHWNKSLFGRFKVINKKLNFTRKNFVFLNIFFNPLINLSPMLYERFFCYLLPCSEIKFKLRVIK